MLRRLRHQAILLDRFWDAVRNDPGRRALPPAGLNPEIADLATRLVTESRSLAPTNAFRAELRTRIEAAAQAQPVDRPVQAWQPASERTHSYAEIMPDDASYTIRRHPAAEWTKFAAAALAFIVVGALLVALLRDSGDDSTLGAAATATPAPTTPTPDPLLGASVPPEVPNQIALDSGRPSWGIAVGAGSIWAGTVTDDSSAIVRAAPTNRLTGEVEATIPLSGRVWDVAYGYDSVWATVIGDSLTSEGSALIRIDPATNAITATIPLGAQPTSILIDDTAIWVTDLGDPTIWRVDPATNSVAATIPLGEPDDGTGVILARAVDNLWTIVWHAAGNHELVKIDPATNMVIGSRSDLSAYLASDLVAGGGSLWAATATNELLRIDPNTGEIIDRVELPGFPRALLADDDYLWVATMAYSTDDTSRVEGWENALVLIDAPSGRIHTVTSLHEDVPFALAVNQTGEADRVWISLASEADQQARLRGEVRPSSITFNPYPPTATTGPDTSTPEATPSATPTVDPSQTSVENDLRDTGANYNDPQRAIRLRRPEYASAVTDQQQRCSRFGTWMYPYICEAGSCAEPVTYLMMRIKLWPLSRQPHRSALPTTCWRCRTARCTSWFAESSFRVRCQASRPALWQSTSWLRCGSLRNHANSAV